MREKTRRRHLNSAPADRTHENPDHAPDSSAAHKMVPGEGIEPSRYCYRQILSLLRLPFRHPGLTPVAPIVPLLRGSVQE